MHRRLTFASPVRTVSRDFRFPRGVLVFSVPCVTRGRHRAPALPSQLPFLIERGFCVLHAPSILLTVDARFALDQQWTARRQFVRGLRAWSLTTVTSALERAARQRSLFAYDVRRAEAKIENFKAYSCTVEMLLCPHEYLYEYIARARLLQL